MHASILCGEKKVTEDQKVYIMSTSRPKRLQRGYSRNEKVTARELRSYHCNFKIVNAT